MKLSKYMNDSFVFSLLFLVAIIWGVGFPISKMGIDYIPPFTFAFLRFLITSILFSVILIPKYRYILKDTKENFFILSLMALSGFAAYNFFYLYSLKLTLVSNSALIVAFNPALTTLLAVFILKEKINLVMIAGIIISLLGVIFIISHGSLEIIEKLEFNTGDLFMIVATFLWAIYSVAGKILMKKLPFLEVTGISTILGTIYLAPFALFESGNKNLFSYPVIAWASVLYMAIFATFFGFSIWYKGIERFGAAKTSIFVNLVPVFGVTASIILLHEKITASAIIGGLLVIAGVIITNRAK